MRRKIAYAAPAAAVLAISLTGCMGIGDDSKSGSDNGGVALSASQVMSKAANKTADVDTYKISMRTTMSGKMGGKQQVGHMSGTGQYQRKPSLAFAVTFDDMEMGGQKLPGGVQTRLVDRTLYVKMGMLQKMTGGKPWLKISADQAGAKSGMNIDQLMSQAQELSNPATYTKMFTTSADVRKVGEQTVRGEQTTHYTGTIDLAEAFGKVAPQYRKAMKSQVGKMKKANFDLYADDQQLPRKIVLSGKQNGSSYSSTMFLSGFGDPVHVAAPPASQTTDASKLKGMTPH